MSTPILEHRSRRFQVWKYSVSLSRLLLRSTKEQRVGTRVDVYFQNVSGMSLPALLEGLSVSLADEETAARVMSDNGWAGDASLYVLEHSKGTAYVAAEAVQVSEDSGEYFEPSSLWSDEIGF